MNPLDWLLIALLAYSVAKAFLQGFFRGPFTLAGFGLLLAIALGNSSYAVAQSTDTSTLSVNVREVLVPVDVVRRSEDIQGDPTVTEVSDLTARDFHIFEDDKEVRVVRVVRQEWPGWDVRDNGTRHCETTNFLNGIWEEPEARSENDISCSSGHIYFAYFVPLAPATSSCHKIKVKIDRPSISIRARQEYCDGSSLADPLAGSKLGRQLESGAKPGHKENIPLTGQVGVLLSKANENVIDVALEFPWKAVKPEWYGQGYFASVGVLGMAYRRDGSLAGRFSDPGFSTPGYTDGGLMRGVFRGPRHDEFWEYQLSSQGYERQIVLLPGDYNLKVVLTNGRDFGRVEMPLNVSVPDLNKLSISSIFLCKHFHEPSAREIERRPSAYVPLMSKGVEFTPSGDTSFSKGEHLFLWFQIYVPPHTESETKPIQFKMTVTNVQTGKTEADSKFEEATSFVVPGDRMIGISKEIGFDKLQAGIYRVDVTAIDPAETALGTVKSSTTFTIEAAHP